MAPRGAAARRAQPGALGEPTARDLTPHNEQLPPPCAGLACYYGGMVQPKNYLHTVMQVSAWSWQNP